MLVTADPLNPKQKKKCPLYLEYAEFEREWGVYEHKRALIAALVYKTWIYVVVFLGKITSSSPRFKGDTTTNQLINHQSIKQEL